MANKLMYEGKAKRVYSTDNADEVVIEYKNTATALNGLRKEEIDGKGVLNCKITTAIYKMLTKAGIPNHFIKELSDTEMLCKKVQIVPLEVIVRNVAAGSFAKRFGVEEGTPLKCPTLEYCYKDDALGDPMINDSHILALGLATKEELTAIADMTMKINDILIGFFKECGIRLIDFKIEIGRDKNGALLLADEISPDTCRLWDIEKNEKLDKDRFRRNMGNVIEAYEEVFRRIEEEEAK